MRKLPLIVKQKDDHVILPLKRLGDSPIKVVLFLSKSSSVFGVLKSYESNGDTTSKAQLRGIYFRDRQSGRVFVRLRHLVDQEFISSLRRS
jgi:hypothetical protein